MRRKTEADFAAELEELRQRLTEAGRSVQRNEQDAGYSGIRFDFDLPYSTLPSLEGNRWTNRGFS